MSTKPLPRTRDDIYFASVDGEGVLLDIRQDRYIGLGRVSALIWAALETHREGATTHSVACLGTSIDEARAIVGKQVAIWEKWGLLRNGAPKQPTLDSSPMAPYLPPSDEMSDGRIGGGRPDARTLFAMIAAWVQTHRVLKFEGLAAALRDLGPLRGRPSPRRSLSEQKALVQCIRAYRALRRVHQNGRPDCLVRSMALTRLLRARSVPAALCIGVRKFPFRAHAWVSVGETVVNETLDKCRSYHPIATF